MHMKNLTRFLALAVLLAVVGFAGAAPAFADEVTLYPGDDAWVDMNHPAAVNDGIGLRADYSYLPACTATRLVYLRFDLDALDQDVSSNVGLKIYLVEPPYFAGTASLWTIGDDWNGGDAGLGGESTLTYSNAPTPWLELDSRSLPASSGWVTFSGGAISQYLNSQRIPNGGDGMASFVVQWDSCPLGALADTARFEDSENSLATGYLPQIVMQQYVIFFPLIRR